jgi:hypothetical protein
MPFGRCNIENFNDVARAQFARFTIARPERHDASTDRNEAPSRRGVKDLTVSVVNSPKGWKDDMLECRRRLQRRLKVSTRQELKSMARASALLVAAVVSIPMPAFAHHSASAFDQTREVVIEGTITKVGWVNPHVYFTVATADAAGATVEREIHAGSVSLLTGMGVQRDALAVGRQVTVRAFPARRAGARVVLGFELETEPGQFFTLETVGNSRARLRAPAVAATGLAGRWLPQRAEFGKYVAGVKEHLTPAGTASAADIASYRASVARCEPLVSPPSMLIPMVRDVALDQRSVKIAVDWMGIERTIHLGLAEHPTDIAPSVQGHSIGRWEGQTLVVDTIGFLPHRSGVIGGVQSGTSKHVVERFSLADDKLHLTYEVTIEDPEYLAQPFSFAQVWDHRPDMKPSGEACDPTVAGRFLELE